MRRGELYRVRNPAGDARRSRVFVVVSRQALIDSGFSSVICAPVFTEGQGLSTQVSIGVEAGLRHESVIFCDNLVSIAKVLLTDYVGVASDSTIIAVNRALRVALAL